MRQLIIKNGPRKDSVFELASERLTIGRGNDNLIVLPDPAASRNHAEIVFEKNRYVIHDLNSTNGVFVGGKKVKKFTLLGKAEIRIGDTVIEYREDVPLDAQTQVGKAVMDTDVVMVKKFTFEDIESKSPTVLYREYQILSAFYNISRTLAALSDFKTAVRDALSCVLDMMKAENGFIFIFNDKTGVLAPEIALNRDTKEEIDFSKCSETVISSVFQTGKALLTSDAAQDDRFKEAQSIVMGNIRSVMCVPIRTVKRTLGVMVVDTRKAVGGFTLDDLEVLSVVAGHIGMCLENARLYDDLRRANEKLLSLDEMKTKFITMAGHELATPLTIIDQYMILLRDRLFGEISEKQQKVLDIVISRVSRLKKIIADVAKIGTGTIAYDKFKMPGELFEIDDLIEEVARELRPLAEGRNQKFGLSVGIKDIFVRANREGVKEVLLNLGINAIKFTPDGGQVSVALLDEKESVRVEVRDTGIGMPQNELDRVFESFYKVEDVKHHHSGTTEFKAGGLGLGLAISKQIIVSQKGKIWVESEEGKGSAFIFTLPKQ